MPDANTVIHILHPICYKTAGLHVCRVFPPCSVGISPRRSRALFQKQGTRKMNSKGSQVRIVSGERGGWAYRPSRFTCSLPLPRASTDAKRKLYPYPQPRTTTFTGINRRPPLIPSPNLWRYRRGSHSPPPPPLLEAHGEGSVSSVGSVGRHFALRPKHRVDHEASALPPLWRN